MFEDQVDEYDVQTLSSGIYLELYETKTGKAVPGCRDMMHVLYGTSYKQKELNKELAALQALQISSNVYRGRKPK